MVKFLMLSVVFLILTSCTALPSLMKNVEEIADNDTIDITISKDAIKEDTNVDVNISVQNTGFRQQL